MLDEVPSREKPYKPMIKSCEIKRTKVTKETVLNSQKKSQKFAIWLKKVIPYWKK